MPAEQSSTPIHTDHNKPPGKRRRKKKGENKNCIIALETNGLEVDKITFEVSISNGV